LTKGIASNENMKFPEITGNNYQIHETAHGLAENF
jgi:hypothetical protein